MTIIHSSDLGWTAGQDISDEFAAIAQTLKSGDTFVFDAMYDISGSNIEIGRNVTLKGGIAGAGINVTDTDGNNKPLLELSDNTSLTDLTVTHSSSSGARSNKVTIKADADDVTVSNSYFSGNTSIFLDVTGQNLVVEDSHFDGGFYQMRWLGEAKNFVVDNTLFENSLGDGIKTARGGGEGTQNALIVDSVFLNNHRDGIDTTGGFKDSTVLDSYFVGNGVSGLDIKTPIWEKADLSLGQTARNITIEGSEFINNGNHIVLTTNDRAELLTNGTAEKWMVQDISVTDSIFENTSSTKHAMVLAKGATGVHAENVTFLGKIEAFKAVVHNYIDHLSIDVNTDLSVKNVTTGQPRSGTLNVDYAAMAGTDMSSVSAPVDNPVAPPQPTEEQPDPISVVPSVDEQDDGGAATGQATNLSDLLEVFVAFTDSDETIIELGSDTVINSSLVNGRGLTIYAMPKSEAESIGSVKLVLDGIASRVENVEPYALFGDDGRGNFQGGKALSEGSYTVELFTYEGRNGTGDILEELSFDFAVESTGSVTVALPRNPGQPDPVDTEPVAEIPAEPEPTATVAPESHLASDLPSPELNNQLLKISLIDTSTDEILTSIDQGMKLSRKELEGSNFTISAETINSDSSTIGSVRIDLDGEFSKVENVEPYALFGDNSKGNFYGGMQIEDGSHTMTLAAYSAKNGKGSLLEEMSIEFEVGDYDSVLVSGNSRTVLSYSAAQDHGTATVSKDQSAIELKGSTWKALQFSEDIQEDTVLEFDFKSGTEAEINGIGFLNEEDNLESTFFQIDGSQDLGIQDFNGNYETGSGFKSYSIPVGEYFTGPISQIVLVCDDDSNLNGMSTFDNISLFDAIL